MMLHKESEDKAQTWAALGNEGHDTVDYAAVMK